MKFTRLVLLLLFIFLLISGCDNAKQTVAESPITPSPEIKQESINFELSSFKIDYKDDSDATSGYVSETYTGTGIITAVGDQSLVKKPYSVLIDIKKISGGAKNNNSDGTEVVTVINGIGSFTTSDWNYDRNAARITKPAYDVKIIAYQPFIELNKK